ncbi:hypothetical protein BV898_17579 [Hypsibius exemplaris]|uniref:DDE-1 domain-containing protein n=1 Tax=Hypsibius exemplaris TaxID=2072580 RepID=A0A9X6NH44_HYPEX|nr:hypothetical protein BV898_17579 [Hypsibius exemplaris]
MEPSSAQSASSATVVSFLSSFRLKTEKKRATSFVPFAYKQKAVNYYHSEKTKKLSAKNVMHAFPQHELQVMLRTLHLGGSGHLGGFKTLFGVCDCKITEFVTKNTQRRKKEIRSSGKKVCRGGENHVEALIQSDNAMTHSYTIMVTSDADGRLLTLLYIVIQEPGGKFGPRVLPTLFTADNVHATASSSGLMTKAHMLDWFKNVFFPHVNHDELALVVDSWTSYRDFWAIDELVPDGCEFHMLTVPAGATEYVQPLDLFGFCQRKQFVRIILDRVVWHDFGVEDEVVLHRRNTIIKLQSLVHNQFSSPRQNLWEQQGIEKPARRLGPQCLPSVRSKENIQKVEKLVNLPDPYTHSSISKQLGLSEKTVRRIIKHDLDGKVRSKSKPHALSDKTVEQRVQKGLRLLKRLQGKRLENVVSIDEAWCYMSDVNGRRKIYYQFRDR